MAKKQPSKKGPQEVGIATLKVRGYKSIVNAQEIEIRPLTILAGANSSGKSSIMQPLLLLKQTLESTYDPGALKLDGPHVSFTSADQLLSIPGNGKKDESRSFDVGIGFHNEESIVLTFEKNQDQGFRIKEMQDWINSRPIRLRSGMTDQELRNELGDADQIIDQFNKRLDGFELGITPKLQNYKLVVRTVKCLIWLFAEPKGKSKLGFSMKILPNWLLESSIESVIHVPGLRGNPQRAYLKSGTGPTFPGQFHNYTASMIAEWQEDSDERIDKLGEYLEKMGLTWKVEAAAVNATAIEIMVGRNPGRSPQKGRPSKKKLLVNIADVGFGVSQTLPTLVALLTANPGQLVYIEQPELHLHPRAQLALAEILAEAAKRGVKVVVETHSSLLLIAVQTLIAEGRASPDLVKLHWFERDSTTGATTIRPGELDEKGRFGDWPQDFGDVELDAESRYLDALGQ